ncbi:MAG: metal ABC transporter permease [Gemmatimonadales bacterium]|nr:MAG: metal ABC transporter permease [Gemmatimonadales bacterium]
MGLLHDLLFDYTLRTVALGSATLGAVSGSLGVFAVLRREALLGDAISHAALPGIVLAFMLTGSKSTLLLVGGAFAAGWIGMSLMRLVTRNTRIPPDTALGIVLSVFFGFGLMLLTFVQRRPDAAQAGLETFLFGQAATLVEGDVVVIGVLGFGSLATMSFLWKEFKVLSFDPEFGGSVGIPIHRVELVLTTVLVLAIVTGLQTVGVVLMAAMVVAPAAAARQWTDRLGTMVWLAAVFGGLAGVVGAVLSSTTTGLPTGPTIVLCASVIVGLSMAFAPRRGLVWERLRSRRRRSSIRRDTVLLDLYALYRQHSEIDHGHPLPAIAAMSDAKEGALNSLLALESEGLARLLPDGAWGLTPDGRKSAEQRLAGLQQGSAERP